MAPLMQLWQHPTCLVCAVPLHTTRGSRKPPPPPETSPFKDTPGFVPMPIHAVVLVASCSRRHNSGPIKEELALADDDRRVVGVEAKDLLRRTWATCVKLKYPILLKI